MTHILLAMTQNMVTISRMFMPFTIVATPAQQQRDYEARCRRFDDAWAAKINAIEAGMRQAN